MFCITYADPFIAHQQAVYGWQSTTALSSRHSAHGLRTRSSASAAPSWPIFMSVVIHPPHDLFEIFSQTWLHYRLRNHIFSQPNLRLRPEVRCIIWGMNSVSDVETCLDMVVQWTLLLGGHAGAVGNYLFTNFPLTITCHCSLVHCKYHSGAAISVYTSIHGQWFFNTK